jgi:phosphomethylpyrimidine synthase
MDLSTGGDVDRYREAVVRTSRVPVCTVPIYSMGLGRRIEDLTEFIIMESILHQTRPGVDSFTIHAREC